MRKIFLASTALVALTSVSAMASDITISGSSSLIMSDDASNTNGGGSVAAEMDMGVSFATTMENGMTAGMGFALHEASGVYDGLSWTLGGDFGTLKVTPNGTSSNYVAAMDDTGNYAGEGADISADILGNARGTAPGTAVGLALPAMSGVSVAMEMGQNHFGYGATMGVGPASVNIAQMKSPTLDGTSASVALSMGDISVGYEQNKNETSSGTSVETEGTIMGVKYTMGATTLAYEAMSHKTDATKDKESTQIQASYTVTPGVTAIVSSSDTSVTASGATTDAELTEVQLKISF
jgi:hypothetical protein